MGLTIYYSGSFNKNASLSEMIEEVRDIAKIYKWKYRIYEENFSRNSLGKETFNKKIYGICFTPPECETVSLSFLSNGKMSSSFRLKLYGNAVDEEHKQFLYMLSTKTQFAGVETHKILVHLLKYLSKKYFSEFKVIDEGRYWETGDEKILKENFRQYNELLDGVSSAIQNFPMKSGEKMEEYFERVLKKVHLKKKKK